MKRRILTFLRRSAIGFGLALAAFLLWSAWYTSVTGRRLEARLAAIRDAGEPISLADFAARPIPPETNADVVLEAAAGDLEAVQEGLMAIFPETGRPDGPLTADDRPRVEALFRDHPRAIPRLLEAAERPDSEHAYDVSLPTAEFLSRAMEHIQRSRTANRVLAAWSTLLTSQGKRDEAISASIAGLKLSLLWAREPLLIGYLVAVATGRNSMIEAERALRAGPVSEEARRRLDAELARHDEIESFRRALRTERAFSLTTCRELSRQFVWPPGWFLNNLMLMFIDFYDEQMRRCDVPFADLAALGPPAASRAYWHPLRPMVDLLDPALHGARRAADTRRAAVRALRLLVALHTLPPDAPAPADLAALGLPAEATLDPFTGRPLIVKKAPGGWLVYSVGPDLVDDGGVLEKARDVGVGPAAGPTQGGEPAPGPALPPAAP